MNVQKIPALRPVGIMLAVSHVPVMMVIHCKTSKSTNSLPKVGYKLHIKTACSREEEKTQM